jgi:hypothetical protein
MTTRIWNKKETQAVLKELRTMYNVDKLPSGYSVKDDQGTEVLRAMIGNGSYLVRFSDGLFETN